MSFSGFLGPEDFGSNYVKFENGPSLTSNWRYACLVIRGKDQSEFCFVPSLSFMRGSAFAISEEDKCAVIVWGEQIPPYRAGYRERFGHVYCNGYFVTETNDKPSQLYNAAYKKNPGEWRADVEPSQALYDRVAGLYSLGEQGALRDRRERMLKAASAFLPKIKNSQRFDRALAVELVAAVLSRGYHVQVMMPPFAVHLQSPDKVYSWHDDRDTRTGEDGPCVALLGALQYIINDLEYRKSKEVKNVEDGHRKTV